MKHTVKVRIELMMSYDDVEWHDPDLLKAWIRNRCWETLMTEGEPSDKIDDLQNWEVTATPIKEG